MSKVTTKIKWQHDSPTLTLRTSGRWDEVIKSLHHAAEKIKEQAIMRGHVGMNRARRKCEIHETGELLASGDSTE